MFEVDVKNVTEEQRGGGWGDQLRFGVLIIMATYDFSIKSVLGYLE